MGERRLTTKGIAFFGALTVILLLLHAADEIARGEAGAAGGAGTAVSAVLVSTLWVFGIGWAWKERRLAYVILLVLSVIAFFGFIVHPFALGTFSLEAIVAAYTSEAVGVFFLFALLAWGLTSLVTLLLSIYALAVPKR